MRRADRLFQIIQILRRTTRPVTAAALAQELETSKRSVYRDIADLIGQRVPIRGEAGFGYVLEGGFDLPPLMLTPDEAEAAALGAQWVIGRGDAKLARAAQDLMAKLLATMPEDLRPHLQHSSALAAPPQLRPGDGIDVAEVRLWIRQGRKISLEYRDSQGVASARVIWPVAVGYMDTARMVIGWCELRQDFRLFRTDRVASAVFLPDKFPKRAEILRREWRRQMAARDD